MNEYPQYMAKKKTIWKNRQGNICFRYEHHSRWWIIPCIVVTLTEYFMLGTYLAIIPSIFISLFVIYNCTLYRDCRLILRN